MIDKIGEDAGLVWRFLHEKGAQRFSKIVSGTNLEVRRIDRAIGWLAREGKIQNKVEGKIEIFTAVG